MTSFKVEFGWDLSAQPNSPFFTLDDPVKGVLDNNVYVLGGTQFVDVTRYLVGLTLQRGKSRGLDRYQAGTLTVTLDNRSRAFDPTFEASPFYGSIVPHREVRVSYGAEVIYQGNVDDWNLTYDIANGQSIAEAVATDGFSILNNQTLDESATVSQKSGARITAILDDPNVSWPTARRDIDTGVTTLGADTIPADQNVLAYLQLIETTEFGSFFIDKNGNAAFKQRNALSSTGMITLADDGSGILYNSIVTNYGSELLYNQVVINRVGGAQVVADDVTSQARYGIQTLTYADLLMATDQDVIDLATFLATFYAEPEFRFEAVNIRLESLSTVNAASIMNLELTDVVKLVFTPNGIAPAITRYAEVIAINVDYSYADSMTNVTLGFSTLDNTPLVLDDPIFGRLDEGNVLGY